MDELSRLGHEARAELGAPSEAWLTAQKQRLLREPLAEQRPRRSWLAPGLAFAALASMALLLVVLTKQQPAASSASAPLVLSASAKSRQVQLQDGSTAILAAAAQALVSTPPGLTRFELLHGSAEFEVVPQQGRTFVVVAGKFEITVIGTRFQVEHGANGAVAVAVSHGTVAVRGPGREPIRLRSGERFQSQRDESTAEPASPTPANGVAGSAGTETTTSHAAASAASARSTPGTAESTREGAGALDWEDAYRERRYAAAVGLAKVQGVERLLTTLPPAKLAALADAARLGGDAELALRALQSLERRFPGSPQAADAEFLIGRLYASRGDSAGALARLEKYLQRGERAPYAVEATGRLVELYSARGDTQRAQLMAKRYLERAPDGPYRRLCLSVLQKP